MLENMTPDGLSRELLRLSDLHAMQAEKLAEIQILYSDMWPRFREEVKSDKQADIKWMQTKEGKEEIYLKASVKSKEKRISAIKTYLRHLQNESKNQY